MIVAKCRGEHVIVEGVGQRQHLRVVRWPNGVKTREHENEVEDERVVTEDDEPDEG